MEPIAGAVVMPWVIRGAAVILGGVGGYLLYRTVGCRTGYCPITRNPWISTIYGAVLGGMMFWK
jgi:hypothetical protein